MRVGRLLTVALTVLLYGSTPARADEAKPPKLLSQEDQARRRAAVSEARAAEKRGDHKAAAAAYVRALALRPDDEALLSELGWQQFQAGELALAETNTRKAIALGGRVAPAALYNLGRILEVRGDKPGATKAYTESLQKRSNKVVLAALAHLDPGAAKGFAPATAQDADDYAPEILAAGEPGKECHTKAEPQPGSALGAIQAARFVLCGDEYDATYQLAVRVDGRWFQTEKFLASQSGTIEVRVHRLGEEAGHLVLRVVQTESTHMGRDSDGDQTWLDTREEYALVCGVGPSKKPSCTPLLQLSGSSQHNDRKPKGWDATLTVRADSFTVTADKKSKQRMDSDERALLGTHPLAHP